jgi:hypothetical protein
MIDQQTIAQRVFSTMADIQVVPSNVHINGINPISSMIPYIGASEGIMLIDCSPELAFSFTGKLLSIPPGKL